MQHALHRSRIAAAQPADDRPHDNRMPVKPGQVSQLINPAAIEAWAYCSRSPAERLQTCAGNFRGLSVGEGDSLYSRQITQLLRLPSHAVSNRIEAERFLCPRQSSAACGLIFSYGMQARSRSRSSDLKQSFALAFASRASRTKYRLRFRRLGAYGVGGSIMTDY